MFCCVLSQLSSVGDVPTHKLYGYDTFCIGNTYPFERAIPATAAHVLKSSVLHRREKSSAMQQKSATKECGKKTNFSTVVHMFVFKIVSSLEY